MVKKYLAGERKSELTRALCVIFILLAGCTPETGLDLQIIHRLINSKIDRPALRRSLPSPEFPCTLYENEEVLGLFGAEAESMAGFTRSRDLLGQQWLEANCYWTVARSDSWMILSIGVPDQLSGIACTLPDRITIESLEDIFFALNTCDGELRIELTGHLGGSAWAEYLGKTGNIFSPRQIWSRLEIWVRPLAKE